MKLNVHGIDCAHCAAKIESEICKLPNVLQGRVSFLQESITVSLDSEINEEVVYDEIVELVKKIEPGAKIEYPSTHIPNHHCNMFSESHSIKDSHFHSLQHDGSCCCDSSCHEDHSFNIFKHSLSKIRLKLDRVTLEQYLYISGIILWGFGFLVPSKYSIYLYVLAYVLISYEIIIKAFQKLFSGNALDESMLMTVASIGAFIIGEVHEGLAVMTLFKVGEMLEDKAVERSKASLKNLLELQPDKCVIESNNQWINVNAKDVKPGTLIMLRPGDKAGLDGIIETGSTFVDNSALTGESVPISVGVGDEILAGMTNADSLIYYKSTKDYDNSAVAKLLTMIQNAMDGKAKIERFVTRFSKVFTPVVLSLAGIIAFIVPLIKCEPMIAWIYRALTFLVISCPCAMVLSIPLAYFSGIGAASKRGILVKGGQFFDKLSKANTFVFDKTGTLTTGIFTVDRIVPEHGFTEEDVLFIAAAGEATSTHPLARAIVDTYGPHKTLPTVYDAKNLPGKGISFTLNDNLFFLGSWKLMDELGHNMIYEPDKTSMFLATKDYPVGIIYLIDDIKVDAKELISKLNSHGKRTILLSGDREESVARVANSLGITEWGGDLYPEDKLERISALKNKRHVVAFIGDGINDGPAMAQSHVGIAMGSVGSAGTIEVADFVIMGDNMVKVGEAYDISRKTELIIKENLWFILSIKFGFLTLGALGLTNVWMAVFADVGVALLAVLNSSRLLKYSNKKLGD
ncbi:MAG: cadmium-translocating P-type ATPase [Tissierellia bacterium]|nr:cadmium-translocating P-type ATPase [Tissierellia bacterium]